MTHLVPTHSAPIKFMRELHFKNDYQLGLKEIMTIYP